MLQDKPTVSTGTRMLCFVVALLIAGSVSAQAGDLFGTWHAGDGSVYTFKNTGGTQVELNVVGSATLNGKTNPLSGKYYPMRYMANLSYGNGGTMMIQVARDGRTAQVNWAGDGKTGSFLLTRPGVQAPAPQQARPGVPITGKWYSGSTVINLTHDSVATGRPVAVYGGWLQDGRQVNITQGSYNPATKQVELAYQLPNGTRGRMSLTLSANAKTLSGRATHGVVNLTRTPQNNTPPSTSNAISINGVWNSSAGSSYTFRHTPLQGTQAVAVSGGWVQNGSQSTFTSGTYYPDRRYVEVNYRMYNGVVGVLRLTVSQNGASLSGTWSQQGQSGNITISRGNAGATQKAPVFFSIAGRWRAQGAMLVLQHGTVANGKPVHVTGTWTAGRVMQVKGTYNPAQRRFQGQFADAMTTTGTITLNVSSDGRTLSGSWQARGGSNGSVSFIR